MINRIPVASGSFYEADKDKLRYHLKELFDKAPDSSIAKTIGLLVPHAGYLYSGQVAAYGYKRLTKKPGTVFLLGPNHSGIGSPISIFPQSIWQTPLGEVKTNNSIIEKLSADHLITVDENAHRYEHSLEVQLPFLQYLFDSNFSIVPLSLKDQSLSTCIQLGKLIASVWCVSDVIIASTDLTHYENQKSANSKDHLALEAIKKMDTGLLSETIAANNISMCGPGAAIAVIEAARQLRANKAEILNYATSGEVTGDYSSVVGYAAVAIE